MTIKDLGRWASLEMIQRYTRSVTFHNSLQDYTIDTKIDCALRKVVVKSHPYKNHKYMPLRRRSIKNGEG